VTEGVLFREQQHFRQIWLWLLLLAIALISWLGAVQQVVLGMPFGANPGPDRMVVLIALVFGTAFPLFFVVLALQVEVRGDGLHYRFFPFHLRYRRIGWNEMSAYAPVSYSPLSTYGGWGIRWGAGGKAYNVAGNQGVRFCLADGRKILFGSADPSGFAEAVYMASGIGADPSGVCDNTHRPPV
jgi:hypothetical protein